MPTLTNSQLLVKDTVYKQQPGHQRWGWLMITLNDAESVTLRSSNDLAQTYKCDREIAPEGGEHGEFMPIPEYIMATWSGSPATPPTVHLFSRAR